MTRIFYSKYMPQDPLVDPLFARMSPDHPERVASWLGRPLEVHEALKHLQVSRVFVAVARLVLSLRASAVSSADRYESALVMTELGVNSGMVGKSEMTLGRRVTKLSAYMVTRLSWSAFAV